MGFFFSFSFSQLLTARYLHWIRICKRVPNERQLGVYFRMKQGCDKNNTNPHSSLLLGFYFASSQRESDLDFIMYFFSRYCAQFCFAIKEIQPSEPRASESLNFLIVRSGFFFVLFCFSLLPSSQKARSSPPVQCNAGLDSGKSSNEPPSRRIENFLF